MLQHGAQEADPLLHDYVGTEHLLLGLLSEWDSVAGDVLTSRGLRLDRAREHIVELLSDGERRERPGPLGIPANTFKWPWLRFVASPQRTYPVLRAERERDDLRQEVDNLTHAVALGGDVPRLVAALKERNARLRNLEVRLAPKETPDRERLRAAIEQRCSDWRDVLRTRNVEQGRIILTQLVGSLQVRALSDRRGRRRSGQRVCYMKWRPQRG